MAQFSMQMGQIYHKYPSRVLRSQGVCVRNAATHAQIATVTNYPDRYVYAMSVSSYRLPATSKTIRYLIGEATGLDR